MIGKKVLGVGPIPCKVMLVGEGPGANEAEQGRPFCGASGSELDWVYLKRAAGLRREDVYVTNIVKWRTDEKDSDPTKEDIERDRAELEQEIKDVNPSIIVTVGRIATGWFMDSPQVDMEKHHGIPISYAKYGDKVLVPCFHPAAGLHLPERYYHLIYWDFQQVGRLVRGEIAPVTDPVKDPVYCNVADLCDPVYDYAGLQSFDTEGIEPPWGMSITGIEGAGFVMKAKEISLNQTKPAEFVGHNVLHDLQIVRKMDVDVGDCPHDTMLMAYLIPWLPRGLKPLAFKLCGMEMEHYEDVTRDAQEKIAKEWLQKVLAKACKECGGKGIVSVPYKRQPARFRLDACPKCKGDGTDWPAIEPELTFSPTGVGKLYKPRSVGRSVRALLERDTDLKTGWDSLPVQVRQHPESELGPIREATLDDIPLDRAIHYSARDADATLRVYHKLEPMLKAEGLWNVYEMDKGIIPMVDRMHTNGILIDKEFFKGLETNFTAEQQDVIEELSHLAGFALNPASPLQVGKLLYDVLGLKGKNRSTDEKTMETLKVKYKDSERVSRCVHLINEYRELNKLLGTYVKPLPLAADDSGRIHTRFLLHITASGRLSSRDPNCQNIPTRTERGKLIRAGFIPKTGCKLVSVDLDQIELRVTAHLSEDQNMIEVFRSGKDIHSATAALIYNKPLDAITTQERFLSKTINFGILYGMSAKRLYRELSLRGIETTLDECVGFINRWFQAYPGVREYMEQCQAQARAVGYVECLFGRRRYVQGVWSTIPKVREESLRWAGNHPVQATAAGILKLWMKACHYSVIPAVARLGYCEPLLTVHDELIFEVEEGLEDLLISLTIQEAANVLDMLVPIGAKGVSGSNWSQLK